LIQQRLPMRTTGLEVPVRTVSWQRLVDLSVAPSLVASLAGDVPPGRSIGNVMAVMGPLEQVPDLRDAAFGAAQRRGVGVSMMLSPESSSTSRALLTVTLSAENVATRVSREAGIPEVRTCAVQGTP